MSLNETHDPSRRSWLQSANHPDTDFPIQNLPLGIFREGGIARGGTAIGDRIFDLAAALDLGFLSGEAANAARAAAGDTLNPLMALGSRPASALRARLSDLLRADGPERRRVESHANRLLVPMSSAEMLLPAKIGNFTDFVCSTFHAQRAVRKPLDSPLAPVLTYMPVAYHGRASSIRVSGEDIRRSQGQFKDANGVVQFGPSKAFDFELEVGAFVSTGNSLGSPIPIESAASYIFGYCLLNDWSARDVQFWESMLGPFLSKSCPPRFLRGSSARRRSPRFVRPSSALRKRTGPHHLRISIRRAFVPKADSRSKWKSTFQLPARAKPESLWLVSLRRISNTPIGALPK